MDERVALGLALLSQVPEDELELPTVFDRLEAVTTNRRLLRAIVDRAEAEGLIERDERTVRITPQSTGRPSGGIVRREGSFTCERCGTDITEGWFLELEPGTLGPYGSTCIRRVTGREG